MNRVGIIALKLKNTIIFENIKIYNIYSNGPVFLYGFEKNVILIQNSNFNKSIVTNSPGILHLKNKNK